MIPEIGDVCTEAAGSHSFSTAGCISAGISRQVTGVGDAADGDCSNVLTGSLTSNYSTLSENYLVENAIETLIQSCTNETCDSSEVEKSECSLDSSDSDKEENSEESLRNFLQVWSSHSTMLPTMQWILC